MGIRCNTAQKPVLLRMRAVRHRITGSIDPSLDIKYDSLKPHAGWEEDSWRTPNNKRTTETVQGVIKKAVGAMAGRNDTTRDGQAQQGKMQAQTQCGKEESRSSGHS